MQKIFLFYTMWAASFESTKGFIFRLIRLRFAFMLYQKLNFSQVKFASIGSDVGEPTLFRIFWNNSNLDRLLACSFLPSCNISGNKLQYFIKENNWKRKINHNCPFIKINW